MTREEIINLLEIISAVYPHAKIKDANKMVEAYELILGDYSAEAVYKAARLHLSVNKYFPSPSDIRDNILKAELIFNNTAQHQALNANNNETEIVINGKRYNKADFKEYSDAYVEALSMFMGFAGDGIEHDDVIFPQHPQEVMTGCLPYEI